MLEKLSKTINIVKSKFQTSSLNNQLNSSASDMQSEALHIPRSIKIVKENLLEIFKDCDDFIIREIQLGTETERKIIVAYIKGLINTQLVNTDIVKAITIYSKTTDWGKTTSSKSLISELMEKLLPANHMTEVTDFNMTVDNILSGNAVIFIDGYNIAIQVYSKKERGRHVDQPVGELVIRGPREAFIESLETNISLLRRVIKSPNFKIETFQYGNKTKTAVSICYLKGTADEEMIKEVKTRLNKIQVDAVLDTGYIEQFIEDNPFSIFPTVGNSEKPDKVASKIFEGRIAILSDGTPSVLTVPYLFIETLHTSDDYYARFMPATYNRLLRLLALILTITLPGIYVAFIGFHSNVIPMKLLISISLSREGVPFTPFVEALIMSTSFELLKEAGIRIPRPFGQSISIVGALIIGDAAVKAGLVSNIMVIIIALTGICSFIVPPAQENLYLLRLCIMISANILGFLGMSLVIIALLIHMCSLRSFGVPYMAPLGPTQKLDIKDTLLKFPMWSIFTKNKAN